MNNVVPWKERISYGLSDTASNLVFGLITTYLMYFYTDVYGLSVATVGTLFLVARVIDAFDGPFFGILIDRTNTKWGKSRPYFLWLAVPFSVLAVLTFTTPDLSPTGKVIYAYVTYILIGILYSGINIPITSILPSLTSNSQERTVLGSVRSICGNVGSLVVSVAALPIVSVLGGGNDKKGFFLTMMIFAGIALVMFLITFKNTRERVQSSKGIVRFKDGIKAIKGNVPWFVMIIINLIYFLAFTIRQQTTVYYFNYNLNRSDLVPIVMSLSFVSMISIFFIPTIAKYIGKRNTMALGLGLGIFGQMITGIGAHASNITAVITGTIVVQLGFGFIFGLMSVMLADTVDYGEWRSGVRAQGLLTSASSFAAKFGMGIGGAVSALIMSHAGYTPGTVQSSAALTAIEFNFVWLPAFGFAIAALALCFHHVDKHETQIICELNKHHHTVDA
ncbi:glycoside-pentoside-hexuronide (GPH):cation symporter [Sporolactobacillus sp. STCC-11]|uniref:glycoside-pentoside-hexuronide (GPH):cation symporter n=1 Tax=Sporolactobacillus caesalpiniae TaxID=3230362 RepID=UPI0033950DB6